MLRLIFKLIPEDRVVDRYYSPYPYIFRGIFMDWLNKIEPRFVHELHEYGKIRPYSIDRIINVSGIKFILTIFHKGISESVLEAVLKGEKEVFNIGDKTFILAQLNFERISLKIIINNARPIQKFDIRFLTPVYFNTSKGDYPVRFPLPVLLFGNLANIWNYIASNEGKIDRNSFLVWIERNVYCSSYKMETKGSEIGKSKLVAGGLGKVSYSVKECDSNFCRWLEILCRLGEYTNAGGNRTAGMGVMKYQPKEYF